MTTGELLTFCFLAAAGAGSLLLIIIVLRRERREAARLDRLCEEAERYAAEIMETGWEEIRNSEFRIQIPDSRRK